MLGRRVEAHEGCRLDCSKEVLLLLLRKAAGRDVAQSPREERSREHLAAPLAVPAVA